MKNDAGVLLASPAAPTRCIGPEQQPRGRSVAAPCACAFRQLSVGTVELG